MVKARDQQAQADLGRANAVDLIAVLVAVTDGQPRVMTVRDAAALPSGPFESGHRSLQSGLRAWVEQQTRHPLGYVEQLYTFADRDRTGDDAAPRVISISYLGLTREEQALERFPAKWEPVRRRKRDTPTISGAVSDSIGTETALRTPEAGWRSWYDYFPWEDHRAGVPRLFMETLVPRLQAWSQAAEEPPARRDRWQRVMITFGLDGVVWNEELVLQRYELVYEAMLVPEAVRGRSVSGEAPIPGRPMVADHRRILATGMARLRSKIKYRPVVFELMPPTFTLLQLQRCVEALAGRLVHKPNFRRLIKQQELVEETGAISSETGGRPAKLFRFRHAVLAERAIAGTKLPLSRT